MQNPINFKHLQLLLTQSMNIATLIVGGFPSFDMLNFQNTHVE